MTRRDDFNRDVERLRYRDEFDRSQRERKIQDGVVRDQLERESELERDRVRRHIEELKRSLKK